MKKSIKTLLLGSSFLVLLSSGPAPKAPLGMALVQEAEALVGVPFSPVSFAGVARRTTRRAVVYSSSVSASSQQAATAQQQAATAEQQAATAQQQASVAQQQAAQQSHRPDGAPPVGSLVASLPKGCTAVTFSDVQYQDCAGVFYRAAFQGNNLVYVVSQP